MNTRNKFSYRFNKSNVPCRTSQNKLPFFKIVKAECRRLLRCPSALLAMLVTLLSPVVGLRLYRPIVSTSSTSYRVSLNSAYLGNFVLAGALIGAVCFALLTAITLNRDRHARMEPILQALLPPYTLILSRVLSLLFLAFLTQGMTLLFWLPFTRYQIDFHFRFDWYLQFYLIVMLPAMLFAILFVAAVYQFCCHFELTLFSFAVAALLSLTIWYSNWLIRWINPPIFVLSDDFGNYRLFLALCYNRLFLLLFTSGLFAISFLWNRRYQKNWFRSIPYNLQKWSYPLVGFLLLTVSCLCYIKQPFFDHSGHPNTIKDEMFAAEDSDTVFWQAISAEIIPNTTTGILSGKAIYTIQNTSTTEQTIRFFSNPGYKVTSVLWENEPIPFRDLQDDYQNIKNIEITVPAMSTADMTITWSGFPKEWDILTSSPGRTEISKDYLYLLGPTLLLQPRNIHNPNPSNSSVNIRITLPFGITPVFFGMVYSAEKAEETKDFAIWHITNHKPYIYLYGGNYCSKIIDADGSLVEFYYSSTQSDWMEEYHADEILKQVFLYCGSHYGHLHFEAEHGLSLIEIPSIGGGYAGKGSSVMGEESFYRQSFEDALKGSGGDEVLAHEIIHQWWGLGNMFSLETQNDPWSSEGLTVYTTYRLMKEQYGTDYAMENYIAVWEREVADYYQNFYVRHPEYLALLPQNYQDSLASNYNRIRQYCEMPLKILKAEELVGGEEAMDTILSRLFQRDINPAYPYLTYDDFLNACHLTREDLDLALTN